jgi:6-phosphogluconolactonase (cycloisomerase 2 family)
VSTASYVDSFDVSGEELQPRDMAFDYSGKYMFILGKKGGDVTVYKLSENFDVSTAVAQSG